MRTFLLHLMCMVLRRMLFSLVLCSCSRLSMAQNDTLQHVFDGRSMSGWHAESNSWTVKHEQLTGTAEKGTDAWISTDQQYEDVDLEVTYRCDGCEAGVLLRKAPMPGHAGQFTGLYLVLEGPKAPYVARVTLDDAGKELSRQILAQRAEPNQVVTFVSLSIFGSRNRDGHYFALDDLGSGYRHLHLLLRGDLLPANLISTVGNNLPNTEAKMPRFGKIAIGVQKGSLQVKNFDLRDLTSPVMGLPERNVGIGFRALELTDRFYSEGITAGDMNRDGNMDVVSGPMIYLGPDFRHTMEIYQPVTYNWAGTIQAGEYTDSFLEYAYDFNGDGWPDVLKINFEGAHLYLNPKGEHRHWDEFMAIPNVSSETTQLCDVNGDGRPELLMSTGADPKRTLGYAQPDWNDVTKPWKFHAISAEGGWSGHGMGCGDLNGDGRVDILQGTGWWEQPAGGADSGLWTLHEVPFGQGPNPFKRGSDLLVYDVNQDGLPDVISSFFSHGPGLAWFEQKRKGNSISFVPHIIMNDPNTPMTERSSWSETDKSVAFTELHAMALVDMDQDGLPDIVTGKRWWSHGIDFSENDSDAPAVMYWFKMVRSAKGEVTFVPHLINDYTGIGTQIFVTDLNKDGRPDVLTSARKGAYVFFNEGTRTTANESK